jgi:endonuclease/exonuclease/phosphatase family metal-dependent hydrolase
MENNKLRIGTYNIRNVTDYYEKRIPLLINTINNLNADVIGFQEVSFSDKNQLDDILREGAYTQFLAETQLNYAKVNQHVDKEFNIDGNAIVVNLGIIDDGVEHKVLHISPIRCAHMVSFRRNGVNVNYVNVHLHHVEEEEVIRVYQMKSILKWIEFNTTNEELTFLGGDFNTLPNSETYNLITKSGYASIHHKIVGTEPELTFHNKMDAPFKDDSEPGTFDYIFIREEIDPKIYLQFKSIEIYGQGECTVNKRIYASDHLALVVDMAIGFNNI